MMPLRDLSNVQAVQQQHVMQDSCPGAPPTNQQPLSRRSSLSSSSATQLCAPPSSSSSAQSQPQPLQSSSVRSEEDYASEVYDHLFERQLNTLRDANYLSRQREVEERMRVILTDWLVDVSIKFKQRPETFFLTVDIIDRYLMMAQVSRGNLQLVGITACLIAAKHEEIWAPEVRECVQITANTYAKEDIVRVEREIAGALRYRFTLPTSYTFVIRLLQLANASSTLENTTMFFLELTALHYAMLRWRPSTVATAAFLIGKMTVEHRRRLSLGESGVHIDGNDDAQWLSRFFDDASRRFSRVKSNDEITPAVKELLKFAITTADPEFRFKAVYRKYSSDRYGGVSRDPMALPSLDLGGGNAGAEVVPAQQQLQQS